MKSYYNEIDPHAAQWLRNLIASGHIAPGDVDERSIEDVTPKDLHGYTQCHFFAGIGGWAHALDLAGWPRDRPVWTGSCPCQPFSAAGKGAGFADERHLWPAWQHLIAQCRPAIVFGEQVASKAVDAWIDLVHADMEGMGYAFGCVPFPAAGIGAPHIRDRTYWVGHAHGAGLEGHAGHGSAEGRQGSGGPTAEAGVSGRLADADGRNAGAERQQRSGEQRQQPQDGGAVQMVDFGRESERMEGPSPTNGFWRDADWLRCTDGKWRPVEPGSQPLAYGIPGRVGRLRAYGNAIVPAQAAQFIRACVEADRLMELLS